MADAHKSSVEEVDIAHEKEAVGSIHGVDANPAAAALAAATEADKPRMFSKGMIKLWLIVRLLSLVSVTTDISIVRHRVLGIDDERLRLIFDGIHQCNDPVSNNLWTVWSWFLHWHHLHHLQSGTDCRLSVLWSSG